MAIFNCKSCGGDLEIQEGTTVVTCEYCGRQQTVPSMDNEKKVNLFNRANRLRSKCDFDKAASVYESIVAEFPAESEAYWGLCLCKFGIEYVDDPATANKIPTCHRTSYESIFDDSNFDLACENADALAVNQLRSEAKEIDRLQKEILEIAKNEQPFDVFICYKESDENGGRTVDSELAHDIYDVLTEKRYKVFYSRITLKAKLGQDYEPYIFSALNSAKVMLSIGTKFEYFNAVWVKNEWSRFLSLMKNDKSKMLIPCYRDIDPYDMPKEFGNLQGQDLSSPRAFQDLVSNIEKIIPRGNAVQNTVAISSQSIDPLIKRAFMYLEDEDWDGADKCCEKILDIDPENYDAYFVKFCTDIKTRNINEIVSSEKSIDEKNINFQRALKFGNESQKQQLKNINKKIFDKIDLRKKTELYNSCLATMRSAKDENDFQKAADTFKELSGFRDSDELCKQCRDKAVEIVNERSYQEALNVKTKAENCAAANMFREAAERFKKISGYRDSDKLAAQCREKAESIEFKQLYDSACSVMRGAENEKDFLRAQNKFRDLGDFKDSPKLAEQCRQEAMKYKDEAYNKALDAIDKDDAASLEFALKSLNSIKDYKDSEELIAKCEERLEQLKLIAEKADAVEAKKKKRRDTIAAIISMTVVAAAMFMIVLAVTVFVPQSKYNSASALEESGNYAAALSAFSELGKYSDAEERALQCQELLYQSEYNNALELIKSGRYAEALNSDNMGNYRDRLDQDVCNALDSMSDYEKAAQTYESLYMLSNAEEKAKECYYKLACEKSANGIYREAGEIFEKISGFSDSATKAEENFYKYACEKIENGEDAVAAYYYGKALEYSDSHAKYNETYYKVAENHYANKAYINAAEAYSKISDYLDSNEKELKCYNILAEQCYDNGMYSEAFMWWGKAGVEETKKLELYNKAVGYVQSGNEESAQKLFASINDYRDSQQYSELCDTWIAMNNGRISMRKAREIFSNLSDSGLDEATRYVFSPKFNYLSYIERQYSDRDQMTTNAYVGWLTNSSTGDSTAAFMISSDGLSLKYYELSGQIGYIDSQWSSLFLGVRNGTDIPIYLDGSRMFVKNDSTLNYSGEVNGRLYLEFGYDSERNTEKLMVGSAISFYHESFRHTQYNGGIPIDVPIY